MQFIMLLCTVVLPFSLAAPLARRDSATVSADIATVSERLNSLNDSVTAYTDPNDIDTALTIQDKALDLFHAINQTTADVNASQPFSQDDSGTIGVALLTIEPDIFSLLANLADKKPVFDASPIPLDAVIVEDLLDEKQATDELGAALHEKFTPDFADIEVNIIADIDQHFNDTIATFKEGV